MPNKGYISLYRDMLDWEWYQESNMVHIFIHLLLKANHEDGKFHGYDVKRGQLITGLQSLHQQTKVSVQSIRTCLSRLKSTGEITVKSTSKFSIITICKYDSYQTKEKISTYKTTRNSTLFQQTTNKPSTTNNNDNNDNNKEIHKEIYKEKFIPPAIEEFRLYFAENNFPVELADRVFKSYAVADWHKSNGEKIKNWKQTCQQVWFKEENKPAIQKQTWRPS